MNPKINILLFSGMSDKKLLSKVEPFYNLNFIGTIFLNRNLKLPHDRIISLSTPKIIQKLVFLRELYRIVIGLYVMLFKKVDVICGIYLTMHGIYAYYLGKIFRKPIILNIIGTDTPKIFRNKYLLKVVKNSDMIIVRGEKAIEELVKREVSATKLFSIPNHFKFRPIPNNKFQIHYDLIFVGYFNHVKRLDILITAVELVKRKYSVELKVCLLGDGELRNEYEKLIFEKGLTKQFDLVGEQKTVEQFLYQSKIFIMTSEFEGQPMAMVEALASGIPVIMPNISNIPDLAIDGYNALLVEPLDTEGFADAIYKLMTDVELYTKLKKGAENFRSEHEYEFSMENITNIWNDIFIKLGLIEENTNANK